MTQAGERGLGGNGNSGGTGGFPTPSDTVAQNGAFLYDAQGMHKLLPVTTYQSQATCISARGQVVGNITDTFNLSNTPPRIFVRDNSGSVQLLDEPPNYTASYARGINSRGMIAGYATTGTPFLIGGLSSLNGGRLARGRLSPLLPALLTERQAFVYSKGVFTLLPALGGSASKANAINDIGQVVGEANDAGGQTHAVLWQNGSVADLGTLGAGSYANALNASGDVVGTSYALVPGQLGATNVVPIAFLVHKGVMTNLNTLLPANSGWNLQEATGINAKGQIVGNGLHNGYNKAFVLSPPMTSP